MNDSTSLRTIGLNIVVLNFLILGLSLNVRLSADRIAAAIETLAAASACACPP